VGLSFPIYLQPRVLYAYHGTSIFERSVSPRPQCQSFNIQSSHVLYSTGVGCACFIIDMGGISPKHAQRGRTPARRRVRDEFPEKVCGRLIHKSLWPIGASLLTLGCARIPVDFGIPRILEKYEYEFWIQAAVGSGKMGKLHSTEVLSERSRRSKNPKCCVPLLGICHEGQFPPASLRLPSLKPECR